MWAVLVIGTTPAIMLVAGQSIEAAVGDFRWWAAPACGACAVTVCIFLGILATSARAAPGTATIVATAIVAAPTRTMSGRCHIMCKILTVCLSIYSTL